MARSYKRDANGRFAGGGGGSSGKRGGTSKNKASSSGGRKQNKSRVTTTGTFLTRQKGKLAQARRTKAFSSKATVGRSAKEAYKAASGAKRKGAKAPVRAASVIRPGPRNIKNVVGLSRARPGQLQRALGRAVARQRQVTDAAMRGTELRTKPGTSYAVSGAAQQYYRGELKRPKKATFKPMTYERDKKALAARKKRIVDNNKPARKPRTRKRS